MRLLLAFALAISLGMSLLSDSAASGGPGYTFHADEDIPEYNPEDFRHSEVSGQLVIGQDERGHITDTRQYPWRAIVWLGLYDSVGNPIGSCSGTFIGPDAILTAGHCLYDDGWVADIVVVPGKDGTYDPYGHQFAESWWVPDQWILTGGDPEWDWGVIALPTRTLGNTVGWLQVANLTTQTLQRSDLTPAIVGYPGDKPFATMWGGIKQRFLRVLPFELETDIDTFFGQSGSAVFVGDLDSPNLGLIVGILSFQTPSLNYASRIDSELLDDLVLACFEMDCSISHYTEPRPSLYTITQATFCRSDASCTQGAQPLFVGQQAWLRFSTSPTPIKALDGEVYWNGAYQKSIVWPPPPYTVGGFNLSADLLGKPGTVGTFEVRLWVGGQYVGSISASVSSAPTSPPPPPSRPYRAISGGLSRD